MASIKTGLVREGSHPQLPKPRTGTCEYGEEFDEWVESRLEDLDEEDVVAVHQMIARLSIRFYRRHASIPEDHHERALMRPHRCVFAVFLQALEALIDTRDKLDFPIESPPQPIPAEELVPQIGGIYLGQKRRKND